MEGFILRFSTKYLFVFCLSFLYSSFVNSQPLVDIRASTSLNSTENEVSYIARIDDCRELININVGSNSDLKRSIIE